MVENGRIWQNMEEYGKIWWNMVDYGNIQVGIWVKYWWYTGQVWLELLWNRIGNLMEYGFENIKDFSGWRNER